MNTKTIKVSEATNTQLDWLVAKCKAYATKVDDCIVWLVNELGEKTRNFNPTTNHSWMGPIMDDEWIATWPPAGEPTSTWLAARGGVHAHGATRLVAAARCYVALKLGGTVEVPEELS